MSIMDQFLFIYYLWKKNHILESETHNYMLISD